MIGRPIDDAAQRLTNRQIEHVTFVATKADHVPASKRENLRHLLEKLASRGAINGSEPGISFQVAAAVLSTEEGRIKIQNRLVEVVRGVVLGRDQVQSLYVGEVPISWQSEGYWADTFLELPVFRLPEIDAAGGTGIPHLHLDQVLDAVIGDLL